MHQTIGIKSWINRSIQFFFSGQKFFTMWAEKLKCREPYLQVLFYFSRLKSRFILTPSLSVHDFWNLYIVYKLDFFVYFELDFCSMCYSLCLNSIPLSISNWFLKSLAYELDFSTWIFIYFALDFCS